MRFFNLDLHISVIEDIKQILEGMGHSVTSWNISGHNWVFSRKPAHVDVINASNWQSLTPEMCDRFYTRYREELSGYDAFIVTHTPSFALLFEKFGKPIIIVASTRYEAPFTDNAHVWGLFNDFIRKGVQSGRIITVANNKYDAAYAHYFTGVEWQHIPSLCAYTNSQYASWGNTLFRKNVFLFSSLLERVAMPKIKGLAAKRRTLRRGYKWSDLAAYKGIVYVPYNVSTMSIFENYTSNIPMFFPTQKFMRQLHLAYPKHVLSQMSWTQVLGLPPRSTIGSGVDDPNDYSDADIFLRWLPLADFYDTTWMPYITYFDSYDELAVQLQSIDTAVISKNMKEANNWRHSEIQRLWAQTVKKVKVES